MEKKIIFPLAVVSVLFLSGCTLGKNAVVAEPKYAINTVLKTSDGGENWKIASEDAAGKTAITPEVLSLSVDRSNPETLFVGTEKSGLFRSDDGGASWRKLEFPLTQIFGLAVSPGAETVYASGILRERAKIFRLKRGEDKWQEIYSEPANGAVIYALEMDVRDPNVVYAGTSEGMIIKTANGGEEWRNLTKAEGPVNMIAIDSGNSSTVYFSVFNRGLLATKDGGVKIESLDEALGKAEIKNEPITLVADPTNAGSFYLGFIGGLAKGLKSGQEFKSLNVLESSKQFPVRSLAVNPKNGREIFYGAGQVIYRSADAGEKWSTYQLESGRTIFQLDYNPTDTRVIYLGLRKTE